MKIYVSINRRAMNNQLLAGLSIRVDFSDVELVACDLDFQDRIREEVKKIIENEIEATKDLIKEIV